MLLLEGEEGKESFLLVVGGLLLPRFRELLKVVAALGDLPAQLGLIRVSGRPSLALSHRHQLGRALKREVENERDEEQERKREENERGEKRMNE